MKLSCLIVFLFGHLASVFSQGLFQTDWMNTPGSIAGVSDLPVIRVDASGGQSDCFAVMFSGDGGWSKFDQGVCAEMSRRGVSTLGINSLRYIWNAKTPEQMANDLTRLIDWGETKFDKHKIILIGYSCGANLIPFAFNRLNDRLKAKVRYIALLSPEQKADFEFHFYNWANKDSGKAHPVKPELMKMRNEPTLFIYGDKEDSSWCADLMNGAFSLRKLPGGHHFDQDQKRVAAEMLQFKS